MSDPETRRPPAHLRGYDAAFYDRQEEGSLGSARLVVPRVLELVAARSVVDFGCGTGTWLRAFTEAGVGDVLGVDGPHVRRDRLRIPADRFLAADLTRPLRLDRAFDLALCLEVVEHLRPRAARGLLLTLTEAAPIVLFSAALPGQGGTHHINERWPGYWRERFAELGYRRLDPFRARLWHERGVEWWYRQNLLLYASEAAIAASPKLSAERDLARDEHLELVHINTLNRYKTLPNQLRELPKAAWRALRDLLADRGGAR